MACDVVMRDGIVNATFSGYVDLQEVENYFARVQPLIDQATEAHSVHFIMDVTHLDKISLTARKYFIEQFRNLDVRVGKTAVIGGGRYVRVVGDVILQIVSERERVRFFDTREQALAWLEE